MNSPKRPLTPAQAMTRAAALCAGSEQAPHDISEKLAKWGLSRADAEQVVNALIDQGFLNEERYARAFVNDRFKFNGWGRIKIAHQLRLKGVSTAVIDEALKCIDEDKYRERLIELLQGKWRDVKGREPRAAWAAMMRYAASRGFESGIAGDCVKQVTRLHVEDD